MSELVTVVTATWNRPEMLRRCKDSVAKQTYRPIEHIIVNDGPFSSSVRPDTNWVWDERTEINLHLGHHHGGVGQLPRLMGALLAHGEWIAYLDDDNEFRSHHIETLVGLTELVRNEAYPQLVCSAWYDTVEKRMGGNVPPGPGHTDTSSIMHRPYLLDRSAWRAEDGYEADGKLVERWVKMGVPWVFSSEPTLIYHGHNEGRPE